MRLVSYRAEAGVRAGVLTDEGVLDAAEVLGTDPMSLRQLIAEDRMAELRERIDGDRMSGIDSVDAAELSPPIPDPDKIVCIGLNYRSHAAEAGIDPPSEPTFFAKFRNALAPAGATVSLPAVSEKVDYEAAVAFV